MPKHFVKACQRDLEIYHLPGGLPERIGNRREEKLDSLWKLVRVCVDYGYWTRSQRVPSPHYKWKLYLSTTKFGTYHTRHEAITAKSEFYKLPILMFGEDSE